VRTLLILVCLSASATTHLWLAATPLSLPGAGTVYSDILGLIVLHVNMPRRTVYQRPSYTVQGLLRIPSYGTFYNAHMLSIDHLSNPEGIVNW
jgi:hypothetical protein